MTGKASKRTTGLPNAQELDQMSSDELRTLKEKLSTQLMAYKGAHQSASPKPLENPGAMRQTRITIARILTILRKRGG